MSLYDKYKLTAWEQLWADDSIAVVLYRQANGFMILSDNGTQVTKLYSKNFSIAFDTWNKSINLHLESIA